jgi:hypothetical protein
MPQEHRMIRQGTEERNIARLTPVLALNRVPAGMIGWKKSVQVDGLGAIEVSCTAGRYHVVPHGIDQHIRSARDACPAGLGRASLGVKSSEDEGKRPLSTTFRLT